MNYLLFQGAKEEGGRRQGGSLNSDPSGVGLSYPEIDTAEPQLVIFVILFTPPPSNILYLLWKDSLTYSLIHLIECNYLII